MERIESPWGLLPIGWKLSTIDEQKTRLTDYVANGSFASLAANVQYKASEDYAVLIRLVDFNNDFKGDFVYIDEHAYNFLSKSSLQGGEIIISNVGANVGTVFKCPNLNKKMSLAPNAITVSLNGDNDFYYYWFKSRIGQQNIQAIVTGSAQPKFNKTNFRSMLIPVPPLSTQRRISSILSSLDRKIELNNKINATLEEMAQTLFKSWFVDFEPFKNGNFIDTEIGKIPEGWRVGTLGGICDYSKKRVAVAELTEDSYFSTENMLPNKQGAVAASSLPTTELTTGCLPEDVLVSNIRPYFKKILRIKDACGCSTDVMCFHPKESVYSTFMYRVLYDDKFFDFVMAGAKGTKMPRGDKKQIMSYPIVLAPNNIFEAFSNVVEPMLDKCASLSQETLTLTHLRDTLLPRLMSGEIELEDTL